LGYSWSHIGAFILGLNARGDPSLGDLLLSPFFPVFTQLKRARNKRKCECNDKIRNQEKDVGGYETDSELYWIPGSTPEKDRKEN